MPPTVGLEPGGLQWNWAKVSALCVLGIAAVRVHTPKHFLEKVERREGTPIGAWAYFAGTSLALGCLGNFAISLLIGEQPLHGRWQPGEIIAFAALTSGLLLRIWAQSCLRELFTYQVGIRRGHR